MIFIFFVSSLAVDESLFNSLSIYQIMVSTFQDGDSTVGHGVGYGPSHHQGDLQGVINSLDYIKDLGFNAIWMTPIFESTGTRGGDTYLASTGYYPTDCFNIDHNFGGNEKFRELVTAAHTKGLYVFLDGVFGHNGGITNFSPNGKKPTMNGDYVVFSSQDSLDYYKEVAQYWINEYEIDGWRLDLVKELVQGGHNYMNDIREAVYEVCENRQKIGKQWGTLGYLVGEYWDDLFKIRDNVYAEGALKSAFDFPFRYNLVQALAQDENGQSVTNLLNALSDIQRTPYEKGYQRNDIYPNLFIDNHDTFRLGNLIRLKHNIGVDNDNYWRFHKIGIATLATFSGPITIYYGDEYGSITDCWNGVVGSCQDTSNSRTDFTSSARINGRISNFNEKETNLHDFTRALIRARLTHPSMFRGTNGKTQINNVYFNCKYDTTTGDKVVFVTNCNNQEITVSYEVGGVKLYDFVSGEVIYSYQAGKYNIKLEPYGARVFQVYDEDVEIATESSSENTGCDAFLGLSGNSKQDTDRKIAFVIGVAAIVVVFVIIIAIVVVHRMKKKYLRMVEENNALNDL